MAAAPALAHEGGTVGIALSAERLPPGGSLELIGIDFLPDETLEVVVDGPSGRLSLGAVTAQADGHFQYVLALPTSLVAGVYAVDVIAPSGIIQRELLEVDPASPAPALTPTPAELRTHDRPASVGGAEWALLPFAALAAAGLLLVFVMRRSGRRGAEPTQHESEGVPH